jgi:hypothetical protein
MKTLSLVAALAAAALSPSIASAQDVHPLIGVAITGGGDKLATLVYSNGGSQDVRAGNLLDLYGGFEVRPFGSPFAFQGTIGYHFDNASASNGSLTFSRFPIEGSVLWSVTPNFRLGAGVRYATGARLSGFGNSVDFDSQLAPLVQAEYLFTPHMGVQLRYVQEKYTVSGGNGQSIDGSHVGVGFNYYF